VCRTDTLQDERLPPDDIQRLVRDQIGDQWARSNLHGVDLRACLVPPQQVNAFDPSGEREQHVWLVLHEAPGGGDGFGVAYDEAAQGFGLVEFRQGYDPCFHGVSGDFFAALDSM
jgi:hypothetical protein